MTVAKVQYYSDKPRILPLHFRHSNIFTQININNTKGDSHEPPLLIIQKHYEFYLANKILKKVYSLHSINL